MNSFISWIGGKKLLRNKIIEQFPEEYDRYVEVFGGAGWVLFAKEKKGIEVYNDINSDLVNLYKCVKYHPEALQKELDGILMSRELFQDAIWETRGLTDIQKAVRFFVAIKESFGSKMETFGLRPKDMKASVDFLKIASERLNTVVIENRDFDKLIQSYDRSSTLFYLDPPYYKTERYYQGGFKTEDHKRLREALRNIRGKFILSYNDCLEIRELYQGYEIIEVDRNNNLATGKRYKELIIKNY